MATPLVRWGVHPNSITLAAIPLSAAAALCTTNNWNRLALALALAAAFMDFLDGEVARIRSMASAYGNYLEAVVDRVVDGLLLMGFLHSHTLAAGLALMMGNLVSYSKARLGLVMHVDNSDWPGWGDRSDRIVVLLLAVAFGPTSAFTTFFLWLLVAMSVTGCVQRVRHARERIERAGL